MVKISLGNVDSKIIGVLPKSVHKALENALAYKVHQAYFIPQVKEGKWDGYIRLYRQRKGQIFYTGLLTLVRDVLKKHNIPCVIEDNRIKWDQNYPQLEFGPPEGYEARPYQNITVERSLALTRGILKIATGGGKTLIVSRLIGDIKTYPFLFYVLTKDLMEQAHDVLSTTLNKPIGVIGGGKCDIRRITVCTIQTAIRSLNMENKEFKISDYQFDEDDVWDEKQIESIEQKRNIRTLIRKARGIYLDEAHVAACKSVIEVASASPHAYWRYGGSGTPYREDNADILIQALFGKKIVDISASYLIEHGYLIKPYIFFVPIEHKVKHRSFRKIYADCIATNEVFNHHVAQTAKHLMDRGLSVLVLVKQYNQGNMLKTLIGRDVEFVSGKMALKKRSTAIQKFRDKESLCMIATTLADEGLDIPTLDVALLAGGGASATRINQRIGRTLRKDQSVETPRNKSIVVCYDHLVKYLHEHTAKVKRIIKQEPLFVKKESRGPEFLCNEIDEVMGFPYERDDLFSL